MIAKIKNKLSNDIHLTELLKGSSIAFIFKIIGMILGYIFTLLIAKWYGAETMGLYALSLTMLNIFVTIGLFGFDNSLVKFVADYNSNHKGELVKEVYYKSLIVTTTVSLILVYILFINADFFAKNIFKNEELINFFQIASIAIVPFVLLRVNTAMFRGFKNIKLFSFFQNIMIFIFSILLLTSLYFFYNSKEVTISSQVIAIFITSIFSFILLQKHLFKENILNRVLKYKDILKVSLPMLLTSSMALVMGWTDIIMLGIFRGEADVGVYSVLVKLATLTSITLVAINSIAAPKFSELHSKEDMDGLKKVIQHSTKMIFFTTLPIIVILSLFPEFVLGMFGKEFIVGATALWILMFGQLINALSGSVGQILNMTGREKILQFTALIALVINIILNYLLAPTYGIIGVAIATALSGIIWNILCVIYIYKELNFLTIYIPKIKGLSK
jgi:O-antigen/teichoic acid export membrane protein